MIDAMHKFMKHKYKYKSENITAGDDSTMAFMTEDTDRVLNGFKDSFTNLENSDLPHGSGLVLKYLRIGEIVDATPCSTELFKCQDCGYKMIRQLDRFLRYTTVSRKALQYSNSELMLYKGVIAEGINKWANDLPIFRALTKRFQKESCGLNNYKLLLKGKEKERIPESTDIKVLNLIRHNQDLEDCQQIYGKQEGYGVHERISEKCKNCIEAWELRLFKKIWIIKIRY